MWCVVESGNTFIFLISPWHLHCSLSLHPTCQLVIAARCVLASTEASSTPTLVSHFSTHLHKIIPLITHHPHFQFSPPITPPGFVTQSHPWPPWLWFGIFIALSKLCSKWMQIRLTTFHRDPSSQSGKISHLRREMRHLSVAAEVLCRYLQGAKTL